MSELCLAVPRKALFGENDERAFSGFRTPQQLGFDLEAILQKHAVFLPRKTSPGEYDVENDDTYKHFNPGGVFVYGEKIFTCTRIGGEPRLLGRNDILISGHVNPEDKQDSYRMTFLHTLQREFYEELHYHGCTSIQPIPLGYVNHESPELVAKTHFGIVYLIRGNSPEISVRETEVLKGRLRTVREIERLSPPLQEWQRYAFDAVKKLI